MATPEARVKLKIRNYLKSLGDRCWFFMPVSNGMGTMGIPDFICCIDGQFVGIEAKAFGKLGTATPLQVRQIEAIRKAGGRAFVCDNADVLPVYLKVLT